jgi:hypothetical protein
MPSHLPSGLQNLNVLAGGFACAAPRLDPLPACTATQFTTCPSQHLHSCFGLDSSGYQHLRGTRGSQCLVAACCKTGLGQCWLSTHTLQVSNPVPPNNSQKEVMCWLG